MSFLINIYRNIWSRLIDSTSLDQDTHNTYRKIFVLCSLLIYIPNLLWLDQIPDLLFNPPRLSFFVFFSGFPQYIVLFVLHFLVIASFVLIGINKWKRLAGIICFIALIVLSGFKYGFGKIDHEILYPFTILCMSLANWDVVNKKYLPIPGETLLAILIAFGMFTAGILKAFYWIDFDMGYSGFLGWFYPGYYNLGRTHVFADIVFHIPPLFIELLDYFAVLFELSPFLFLLTGRKSFWKIWVVLACLFHLANTALLNIPFAYHTLVFLPFILPYFFVKFVNRISNKLVSYLIVLIASVQIISLFLYEKPIIDLIFIEMSTRIYFDFSLWVLVCAIGICALIENRGGLKRIKPN